MYRCIFVAVYLAIISFSSKAQNTTSFLLDSILIKDKNFKAYLYKPRNLNDLKPIIVFGGSEGGISMINVTRDYALEGFAALNVAYFAYDGLPKYCAEIPLEYFEEPIEWMLNQEYVKSSSIALHGVSKGSELSLLKFRTCD